MIKKAIVFILVFATNLEAQTINLGSLIQEALTNNPSLKSTKHEALSKEAEIGPRSSYDDPMLELGAKNYPSDTLSPYEMSMTGNEIGVSQKIPFPGKLTKLGQSASHEYNAAREIYNNAQLELIRDVRTAYYNYYLFFKKQDILNEQLGLIRQIITVSRSKYVLGKISQAELLGFQMEETAILDQLLTVNKELETKLHELNYLLGREKSSALGRPEQLTQTPMNMEKFSESEFAKKVLEKNPGFHAALSESFSSRGDAENTNFFLLRASASPRELIKSSS